MTEIAIDQSLDIQDYIRKQSDSIVTESQVDPAMLPEDVFAGLKKKHTTGEVVVRLNGGGIISYKIREETKLRGKVADDVRRIAGFQE